MDKIFEILKVYSNGDIILSDDEFNRFVDEMNLPIFKKKTKTGSHTHETLSTVFNGKTLRTFGKATKNETM